MKDNMVFGVHPVEEALASGNEIDRIFIVKSANHPGLQKLSSEARDRGISVKAGAHRKTPSPNPRQSPRRHCLHVRH